MQAEPKTYDDFKEMSTKILNNFYELWKDSFKTDKIHFSETKFEGNVERKAITIGVNVATLKKFSINVIADVRTGHYTEKDFIISIFVDEASIQNFKTDYFDPVTLRNDFHKFHNEVMNCQIRDRQADGLTLIFNHEAKLMSAKLVFTFINNDEASRATQFIYHEKDPLTLRRDDLEWSGVVNYRNFKFLWDYTGIKAIMEEPNFMSAYRVYAQDPESYTTLLKMERI